MTQNFNVSTRFLDLIDLIPVAPKYRSTKEIHDLFIIQGHDVDIRTTQRNLKHFEERFGLISRDRRDHERGKPVKEWAWSKQDGPPGTQLLDPPSALTLQLATQLLSPVLPKRFLKGLKDDVVRAKKVLGQIGAKTNTIPDKVKVLPRGLGRLGATVDPKKLNTIFEALLNEKQIDATYISGSSQQQSYKSYRLNPLGLIFRFDTFYLVHSIDNKDQTKDNSQPMEWPLQRFSSVKETSVAINKPANFDLDKHIKNPGIVKNTFIKSINDLGPTINIKLLFSEVTARYVMERPFSEDQTYKSQADGRVLITATVANTRELLSELLNFADDVEILEPVELRNYFKQVAANLHQRYK